MRPTTLFVACMILAMTGCGGSVPSFPETYAVEGHELLLNGVGVRKGPLGGRLYAAALYLDARTNQRSEIVDGSHSKRLHMAFLADILKVDILRHIYRGFRDASPEERQKLKLLDAWLEPARNGCTLSFTYTPESGTTVEVDGVVKGVVPGDTFAKLIWDLWIGDRAPTPELRDELLGVGA